MPRKDRQPKKGSESQDEIDVPRYWDSQASAAASLKIDVSIIREAKRSGSKAFRSGRVYSAPLLQYFEEKRAARARHKAGSLADVAQEEETKSFWDRQRSRLEYERAKFDFDLQKQKYILTADIQLAVGQMLAGLATAFRTFPTSAARWLVGLKDFWAIVEKLRSELDAVLTVVHQHQFLGPDAVMELADRPFDADTETLIAKWSPANRRRWVACVGERILSEFGRTALASLLQRALPPQSGETPATAAAETTTTKPSTEDKSDGPLA
jgi:hypothetical protein